MAKLTPSKKDLSEFNNGNEYTNDDTIQYNTINNVIESTAWTQSLATSAPDITDINANGTPSVSIVTQSDGTPRLKFSSLVGAKGADGKDGTNGADGKDGTTPQLRINSATNEWQASYDGGKQWNSLDAKATGQAGQDGTTPRLQINYLTKEWEVSYDNGLSWSGLGVNATGQYVSEQMIGTYSLPSNVGDTITVRVYRGTEPIVIRNAILSRFANGYTINNNTLESDYIGELVSYKQTLGSPGILEMTFKMTVAINAPSGTTFTLYVLYM